MAAITKDSTAVRERTSNRVNGNDLEYRPYNLHLIPVTDQLIGHMTKTSASRRTIQCWTYNRVVHVLRQVSIAQHSTSHIYRSALETRI